MVPNRPRLATLRLSLTTEVEWLIPNLILRSGLILHPAAALSAPIGVVTKIGANRNWQCQLPTQIGSNQTANLKVAVVIFHNFLCAIIQA